VKLASLATVLVLSGSIAFAVACSQTADDDAFLAESAQTSSDDLVISQIYGGGGNANAPYTHDFVEIFNRGNEPVSLEGKALQYATSVASFKASDIIALPKVTLEPGRYFLVQLASSGAQGAPLPEPHFAPANPVGLNQAKGKIALVRADAPLDGCGGKTTKPCTGWIDLVGYGTASQAEGSPAKETDKDKAAVRKGQGCIDTGDNRSDFDLAPPAPRTLDTAPIVCANAGGGASNDEDAGAAPDGGEDIVDGGPGGEEEIDGGSAGGTDDDAGAPVDAGGPDDPGGVDDDAGAPADDAGASEKDGGASGDPGGSTGAGDDEDEEDEEDEDDEDDDEEPSKPGASNGGKKNGGKKNGTEQEAAPSTPTTTTTTSGCSMTQGGARGSGVALSIAGMLMGLAALGRRRRSRDDVSE